MSSPHDHQLPETDNSLENRLRGLILNNAPPIPPNAQHSQAILASPLPPHVTSASLAGQQEESKRQTAELSLLSSAEMVHHSHTMDSSLSSPPGTAHQTQPGRKRPNQAQRRQMNAQLSVPVAPGTASHSTQFAREFMPTGSSNVARQNGQSMYGRPQANEYSAPFRNVSQPPPPGAFQVSGLPQASLYQRQGVPNYSNSGMSSFGSRSYGGSLNTHQQQFPQQMVSPPDQYGFRGPQQHRQLYQPGAYNGNNRSGPFVRPEELSAQSNFLQELIDHSAALIGVSIAEETEKETFRVLVEQACRKAIVEHEQNANPKFASATVELRCFGSMASGFATKASDMDLALLTPHSNPSPDSLESPIPRILEQKLLDLGLGARLLTKTRVPIIKLCEKPTEKLLSDLVEERRKWEDGDSQDHADEMDPQGEVGQDIPSPVTVAANKSYEEQLESLKQKPRESLGDYYGDAKRLLRQLGGRDISAGVANLKPREVQILVDVCSTFVNGLSDPVLKARLTAHQSLSFGEDTAPHAVRSLSGVYSQIEGEHWVMAWDQRPLSEISELRDLDCLEQVEDWQKLCEIKGLDTMVYSRQLYVAADRLKKIPSLQLVYLEQGQSEQPVVYHARAAKILSELGGQDQPNASNTIVAILAAHYIAGIRSSSIRENLRTLKDRKGLINLKSLAVHHRMLQIANDYEKCLTAEIYSDTSRPAIQQYIDHVRQGTEVPASILQVLATQPDPTSSHRSGGGRDRYYDRLEFPKHDIGIQCDINFSAQLALHNTHLLRCYSASDPRVKPLVLFVKHWAKLRNINTPYRGTLSSYGYVLMVLHYLVNIASPFVCPNLQLLKREPPAYLPPEEIASQVTCLGRDVQFWKNEREIKGLSERGMLNHNKEPAGTLLRGFFEYYAQNGNLSTGNGRGFDWGRDVLSLRTVGGIVYKQEKGWVGARTVTETTMDSNPALRSSHTGPVVVTSTVSTPAVNTTPAGAIIATTEDPKQDDRKRNVKKEETKEIRHRYLLAIEDPFELDHNVARTVTHNGIVSIRDEFRRAWRIIREVGRPSRVWKESENLLDEVVGGENASKSFKDTLKELHGNFGDKTSNSTEGEKAVGAQE